VIEKIIKVLEGQCVENRILVKN